MSKTVSVPASHRSLDRSLGRAVEIAEDLGMFQHVAAATIASNSSRLRK
jgi:hypothetical protein